MYIGLSHHQDKVSSGTISFDGQVLLRFAHLWSSGYKPSKKQINHEVVLLCFEEPLA